MSEFLRFFKISKMSNLKLVTSQLLRISKSLHRSYLLDKARFWWFFDHKLGAIFKFQKTPKTRFYEQVWYVWWLWHFHKLTCNNFESSDFWNLKRTQNLLKKAKSCHFYSTNFFSGLRYLLREQFLSYVESKPPQLSWYLKFT